MGASQTGIGAMVQLLTPEGVRREHPDYRYEGDARSIAEFYRQMVLVRRVDTEGFALQRHGELGLWPPSLGQEAVLAAGAAALGPATAVGMRTASASGP